MDFMGIKRKEKLISIKKELYQEMIVEAKNDYDNFFKENNVFTYAAMISPLLVGIGFLGKSYKYGSWSGFAQLRFNKYRKLLGYANVISSYIRKKRRLIQL